MLLLLVEWSPPAPLPARRRPFLPPGILLCVGCVRCGSVLDFVRASTSSPSPVTPPPAFYWAIASMDTSCPNPTTLQPFSRLDTLTHNAHRSMASTVVASLSRRLLGRSSVPKQPRRALAAAAEGEAGSGAGGASSSTTTATSREARRQKWLKEKAAAAEASGTGAASTKVRVVGWGGVVEGRHTREGWRGRARWGGSYVHSTIVGATILVASLLSSPIETHHCPSLPSPFSLPQPHPTDGQRTTSLCCSSSSLFLHHRHPSPHPQQPCLHSPQTSRRKHSSRWGLHHLSNLPQ